MPTAFNAVPDRFDDRRCEAVSAGLRACGYDVRQGEKQGPVIQPGDVVVTWNLHNRVAADWGARAKSRGAHLIVAEEGYTRRLRTKAKSFAMALDGHNGSGRWFPGDASRWEALGLQIDPWRPAHSDDYVLICASRGMGSELMREPQGWAMKMARELKATTTRRR